MNTREICIRCKSAGQLLRDLIIMFHTFRTSLLIASHDQTYPFIQLHAGITKQLHCIKRLNHRTFIICRSTSIYIISFACQHERIITPISTNRHDIQMSRESYDFFAFAHLRVTAIIVQIYGMKTKFFCNFQSFA